MILSREHASRWAKSKPRASGDDPFDLEFDVFTDE